MEKFDLNDILIAPTVQSSIRSRKKINHCYDGHLPIIAAPMDTVIDDSNIDIFINNKVNICLPRGVDAVDYNSDSSAMCFKSYGLEEFKTAFLLNDDSGTIVNVPYKYLLIDIANGHMEDLYRTIKLFKSRYTKHYKLMVGNVARPETYELLSKVGADYIRVGIGNGNGCLTTQQTGIGYPMGSLIRECYELKNRLAKSKENAAKIVADGGMKDYSDIIKSLALGADYVMIGSILNKCLESAGQTTVLGLKISNNSMLSKFLLKHKFPIKKRFRGMSTKEVQRKWGRVNLKTSEGIVDTRRVEYSLNGWVSNFEHYLKSAMSYSDSYTLNEFTGLVKTIFITDHSYKRFNK